MRDVVDRLAVLVDRMERVAPEAAAPALSPAQRQEAEIAGARHRVKNWAMALPAEDLEDEIRYTYRNNAEALAAALDELSSLSQKSS
jgi:hypothetical protein